MNSLPPPLAPHPIPLYSITYAEFVMIGIFLLVAVVCLVRRRDAGAFLMVFSALCFALRPALVFTIPSQKVLNLTAYCPSLGFAGLVAFLCLYAMRPSPAPKS